MADEPIATKEAPGPFDGFEHAKPGEPIFTLQGGDPLGAPLVMAWAALARIRALGLSADLPIFERACAIAAAHPAPERKRDELLLRATEAENVAWAMDEYRTGHTPVRETRASYNERDESEDARAALDRARLVKRAEDKLHNALAEASDQADALEKLGDADEGALRMIRQAVLLLKEAAEIVAPKRPSYMTPGGSNA